MRFLNRAPTLWCLLLAACTTGEGSGNVTSENLYVRDCYRGPFALNPTFFGANPYGNDTISIRAQRGDDLLEVSDGLTITVDGVAKIRGEALGEPIQVALPAGVTPPGVPVTARAVRAPVSMALYLHESCNVQNGAIYSLCGSITFESLFSGDLNEGNSEDRLTEARFAAVFGDPREAAGQDIPAPEDFAQTGGCSAEDLAGHNPELLSLVEGHFTFFFQRGPPAQPFP